MVLFQSLCLSGIAAAVILASPVNARLNSILGIDGFADFDHQALFVAQEHTDRDLGGWSGEPNDVGRGSQSRTAGYLTREEVVRLVSGRTTEWVALKLHGHEETPADKLPWGRTYFSPDGRTEGTFHASARAHTRHGRWWIEGDAILIKWDDVKDTFRALLQPDGKGGHYRVRKRDGQKRSHWKVWLEGNQL